MFDDQPTTNQGVGQPPQNLPVGEVDDMFAGTDEGPTPITVPPEAVPLLMKEGQGEVSSMVTPPTAIGAGMLKPKTIQPPVASESIREPAWQPVAPPGGSIREPKLAKWLIMTVVIVVVVGAIGGGGWWFYRWLNNSGAASQVPAEQGRAPSGTTEPSLPAQADGSAVDQSLLFGEPIDTDADNLDDTREESIGTDPRNWDTDGDQLPDGDEVIIWKTQPLNPDTDGDTFLDGLEVKNGYNPTGPGKIFQPPSEDVTPQ